MIGDDSPPQKKKNEVGGKGDETESRHTEMQAGRQAKLASTGD